MENLLVVLIPVVVAVVVWALNESSRRHWEMYKRKEDQYINLMCSMSGFYEQSNGTDEERHTLISSFIEELRRGWLYLPDELIHKGYEFLETVHSGTRTPSQKKELLLGEFVALMRRDLYGRRLLLWRKTKLEGKDYRHLKSES